MEFGYLRTTLKFSLFCVEYFTGLDKCLCLTEMFSEATASHKVFQPSVCSVMITNNFNVMSLVKVIKLLSFVLFCHKRESAVKTKAMRKINITISKVDVQEFNVRLLASWLVIWDSLSKNKSFGMK